MASRTKAQRSASAKKAAATRKKNEEAAASESESPKQQKVAGEVRRRKVNSPLDAAGKARQERLDSEVEGQTGQKAEALEYQPRHRPLQAAGLDHHAAESERQAQLQAERDVHARRTDGISD